MRKKEPGKRISMLSARLELTTRDRIFYKVKKIREFIIIFFFNIELLSIEYILDIPFRITYH